VSAAKVGSENVDTTAIARAERFTGKRKAIEGMTNEPRNKKNGYGDVPDTRQNPVGAGLPAMTS
jgi:hypothetical protein